MAGLLLDPVYSNPYQQQQQVKPKMQEVTLRGYYKKGNDWYYMPIRVGVIGEEVWLLSCKVLIISNTNELVRVKPERVVYVESDGNYSAMVLRVKGNKSLLVKM